MIRKSMTAQAIFWVLPVVALQDSYKTVQGKAITGEKYHVPYSAEPIFNPPVGHHHAIAYGWLQFVFATDVHNALRFNEEKLEIIMRNTASDVEGVKLTANEEVVLMAYDGAEFEARISANKLNNDVLYRDRDKVIRCSWAGHDEQDCKESAVLTFPIRISKTAIAGNSYFPRYECLSSACSYTMTCTRKDGSVVDCRDVITSIFSSGTDLRTVIPDVSRTARETRRRLAPPSRVGPQPYIPQDRAERDARTVELQQEQVALRSAQLQGNYALTRERASLQRMRVGKLQSGNPFFSQRFASRGHGPGYDSPENFRGLGSRPGIAEKLFRNKRRPMIIPPPPPQPRPAPQPYVAVLAPGEGIIMGTSSGVSAQGKACIGCGGSAAGKSGIDAAGF